MPKAKSVSIKRFRFVKILEISKKSVFVVLPSMGFFVSARGTPSVAQLQRAFALGHPWCRGLRAKEKAHRDNELKGTDSSDFSKV
jgi:hypothetical protein